MPLTQQYMFMATMEFVPVIARSQLNSSSSHTAFFPLASLQGIEAGHHMSLWLVSMNLFAVSRSHLPVCTCNICNMYYMMTYILQINYNNINIINIYLNYHIYYIYTYTQSVKSHLDRRNCCLCLPGLDVVVGIQGHVQCRVKCL